MRVTHDNMSKVVKTMTTKRTSYEQVLDNAQARKEAFALQKRMPLTPRIPQFIPPVGMKLCSTCKDLCPKSQFSPNKRTTDGLQSECRACHNAKVKAAAR